MLAARIRRWRRCWHGELLAEANGIGHEYAALINRLSRCSNVIIAGWTVRDISVLQRAHTINSISK
jgi:hypothetical protein